MAEPLGLLDTIGRLRKWTGDESRESMVGRWTLVKGTDEAEMDQHVVYDARAWLAAGGVLIDVPLGGYLSPLDFGDVGFCTRPKQDIGVTVLGTVRYDLRPGRPPIDLPESWAEAKRCLSDKGLGATIRLAGSPSLGWVADLVRLDNADVLAREFVSAPTAGEVSDLLLHSDDLPQP